VNSDLDLLKLPLGLVQQGILVIALRTNEPNKKIIGTICPFTNQNLKIKL